MKMVVCFGTVYEKGSQFYARKNSFSKTFYKEVDNNFSIRHFISHIINKYPNENLDIRDRINENVLVIFIDDFEECYFAYDGEIAKFLRKDSFNELWNNFERLQN